MMTVGMITQFTTDKGPLPKQITALPPVRPEPLLDDIRYAFKHKGWADHMIDDAHLLDTVRNTLDLYCKMRATLVGMVELWKGLTSNH